MQIWSLPYAFEHYKQRITSGVGIELVLYKSQQKIEKANVRLNSNLLVLLQKGQKEVYTPHHKIVLEEGEGFFIQKGHYLMSEKLAITQGYESLMVFFDDQIARQLSSVMLQEVPQPFPNDDTEGILKLLQSNHTQTFAASLKNYFATSPPTNFDEILKIKLQELFWILGQSQKDTRFVHFLKNLQNQQIVSLRQLMEKHYKESIPLEQLAFLGGYSLSTFKRRFKATFQESPSRWIQNRRLQEAYFLLKNSQKNINEIGYEVGFENISHFIQVFKNHFGFTPKEFQKQA